MARPGLRVAIVITGFSCDPDDITRVLGVRPTDVWRRGDTIPPSTRRRVSNGWRLESSLPRDRSLEEHVTTILDRVSPSLHSLQELTTRPEIELACAVYFGNQAPEMYLAPPLLARIAQFGASLDVDLYSLAMGHGEA